MSKKKQNLTGDESFHSSPVVVDSPDYTGLDHVDVLQVAEPTNCLRCTGLLNLSANDANSIQHIWGMALLDHNSMPCHYTKGNRICPGSTVRIIRYADLEKAVDAYIDALDRGDMKRLSIVTRAIEEKDESTAALVMSKINEKLAARRFIPTVSLEADTPIVVKNDAETITPVNTAEPDNDSISDE